MVRNAESISGNPTRAGRPHTRGADHPSFSARVGPDCFRKLWSSTASKIEEVVEEVSGVSHTPVMVEAFV